MHDTNTPTLPPPRRALSSARRRHQRAETFVNTPLLVNISAGHIDVRGLCEPQIAVNRFYAPTLLPRTGLQAKTHPHFFLFLIFPIGLACLFAFFCIREPFESVLPGSHCTRPTGPSPCKA